MSIWKKVVQAFKRKMEDKRRAKFITRYWTTQKCQKKGHKSSLVDVVGGIGEFKCRRCGRIEYSKACLNPEEVKGLSPESLAMAQAGLAR